jgi:hypothetical protein
MSTRTGDPGAGQPVAHNGRAGYAAVHAVGLFAEPRTRERSRTTTRNERYKVVLSGAKNDILTRARDGRRHA